MEQLMNYIIEFSPAITAVIGIIVSLIVGIKKIKANNEQTIQEVKSNNEQILELYKEEKEKREAAQRENNELKKDLRKIMAKLNHVHFEEDK